MTDRERKIWYNAQRLLTADKYGEQLSDEDFAEMFSDCAEEELIAALLRIAPDNPEVLKYATKKAPKYNDYDFERDGHIWRDDVLAGYAEHIKNYFYNYKPEATAIDPSIDPNEEHIGPMAQDIEKVNEAAVPETPEGVKEVDTGRLALMNAGAIAELARDLEALASRVDKLEGKNG